VQHHIRSWHETDLQRCPLSWSLTGESEHGVCAGRLLKLTDTGSPPLSGIPPNKYRHGRIMGMLSLQRAMSADLLTN
jgi:hypothetical protein